MVTYATISNSSDSRTVSQKRVASTAYIKRSILSKFNHRKVRAAFHVVINGTTESTAHVSFTSSNS